MVENIDEFNNCQQFLKMQLFIAIYCMADLIYLSNHNLSKFSSQNFVLWELQQ